jgi:pilus assembly protein CpaF
MTASLEMSPLVQIELEVQRRAARCAIDVDDHEGRRRLRDLVDEVIEEWSDQHRRGQRAHALSDPDGLADRAMRNLAGYGPLSELLSDDDVWEIMVNAPSEIFVRRHSGGSRFHHEVFHDDEHVARIVTKLLEDSTASHRKLDATEGLQDAQLDDGARVHIVHGDLSRGGHLMVNIRKFTGMAITSLDRLVDVGSVTPQAATFLRSAMRARMSIVFAGAPGAGKTTLLSCCAAELDPALRVVIAEEVFEADVPLANVAVGACRRRPLRNLGLCERPEIPGTRMARRTMGRNVSHLLHGHPPRSRSRRR